MRENIVRQAQETVIREHIPFRTITPRPAQGWFCCYDDCMREFDSYEALRTHQKYGRQHGTAERKYFLLCLVDLHKLTHIYSTMFAYHPPTIQENFQLHHAIS